MPNENVNHVVINGVTKLDLRSDTATAADVAAGKTFHLASGASAVGTGSGGGIDGDNLAYGGAFVGTAIVGSALLSS